MVIHNIKAGLYDRLTSDVGLLVVSSAFAQVLNLLAYPLLTRLYTPEDFGAFAALNALGMMLGSVICLRLDALIQVVDPADDDALITTMIMISFGMATLIFVVFACFGPIIFGVMDATILGQMPPVALAMIVSSASFMVGVFAFGRQYAAKTLNYRKLASAQLAQKVMIIAMQVSLVWVFPNFLGLTLGMIVGFLGTVFLLWPTDLRGLGVILKNLRKSTATAWRVLSQHIAYIRVDVANMILSSLILFSYPVLILAVFGVAEAGFFAIASSLAFLPTSVLSQAISTHFFQRFSQAIRDGRDRRSTFLRTLLLGGGLALMNAVAFYFLITPLVALIFDDAWARSGELVIYLLPTLISRFTVGCIGSAPLAMQRPKMVFGWNVTQIAIIGAAAALVSTSELEQFLVFSGFGFISAGAVYVAVLYRAIPHDIQMVKQ